MKANRDMTEKEFNYSMALKRAMNDYFILESDIEQAKTVGIVGNSQAALAVIGIRMADLEDALRTALKTVGK